MKCYSYNNLACCNSVHDSYIQDKLSSILTDPCLRKYKPLETLFCYGCSPLEYKYTNNDKKSITICKSFLQSVWNSTDLDSSTTLFDNCGFKMNDELRNFGLTDKEYIIPSKVWLLYFLILIK
jgi:hypothetical protein